MIIPERLLAALEHRNLSQAALARAVGISTSMINKLARGESRESAHIYAISKALRCSPEFLSGDAVEIDHSNAGDSHVPFGGFPVQTVDDIAAEHGLMPIRQIDLAFGMGATFLDVPVEEETMLFPTQWVRQYTKAPAAKLFFAQGVGDSMQPTLAPNDTLIIDCSQLRLTMADQIWAVTYCGLGMVKRLRPTKDGGIRIMSDNPHIPEEIAFDGELQLIGRVVAVTRKI